MWTQRFWKATAERVVRGAAIAVATVMGLDLAGEASSQVTDLPTLGLAAFYGGLGSLVLSLAGGAFGAGVGPSITGQEELDPPLNG